MAGALSGTVSPPEPFAPFLEGLEGLGMQGGAAGEAISRLARCHLEGVVDRHLKCRDEIVSPFSIFTTRKEFRQQDCA